MSKTLRFLLNQNIPEMISSKDVCLSRMAALTKIIQYQLYDAPQPGTEQQKNMMAN